MIKRLAFSLTGLFVVVLMVVAFATDIFRNQEAYTPPIMTTYSGAVSGGAGAVVFYLTDTKTINGNALFNNITAVVPIINDANTNYTYGWVVSADKKTLTVTSKASTGVFVALINLTVLGSPSPVANGTTVSCMVAGN